MPEDMHPVTKNNYNAFSKQSNEFTTGIVWPDCQTDRSDFTISRVMPVYGEYPAQTADYARFDFE